MKETIHKAILKAFPEAGSDFIIERPADFSHGDYSSNVAMVAAKAQKINPRELAQKIADNINTQLQNQPEGSALSAIEKVEVAGPGFINFRLSRQHFADAITQAVKGKVKEKKYFGFSELHKGKKYLIEYTNPNPFKVFHIGHLMSNSIGEAISRLVGATGAKIVRANYQGDVGLHVAKAIYGMQLMEKQMPSGHADKKTRSEFLGNAYVAGAKAYEGDESAKDEIVVINKKVYDRNDKKVNKLYDIGRKWSLEHFEDIYALLGTKFNRYFFESNIAKEGKKIVLESLEKGIFEKSEGAVVFRGDKYGLHTRVFINKENLPTYEAKEIGLTAKKFAKVKPDRSIVITADEQASYFTVVLKALSLIKHEWAQKTTHIAHGMLVLPTGKMSSRTGDVISGESLIEEAIKKVTLKMGENQEKKQLFSSEKEMHETANTIGIGAIKYLMLRQAAGSNIVYEIDKALSLEGDSGPYLQYACVRARSVLAKAAAAKITPNTTPVSSSVGVLERLIERFPETLAEASENYAPHILVTYLSELAGAFNAFYAQTQIVEKHIEAPYRVALTTAFSYVMENGLRLLAINVPEKM